MNTAIKKVAVIAGMAWMATGVQAQEDLIRQSREGTGPVAFTTEVSNAVTRVKNQHRSGTCWAYATLSFLESEALRVTGRTFDLCEMFVVNKDYMDNAEHYVRLHGYSQISEGGSADDVLDVVSRHGICPESAMPAPGSLVGDSLANFKTFFPKLEQTVSALFPTGNKRDSFPEGWRPRVQSLIDRYIGSCPGHFVYEGTTYTPQTFAQTLGLRWTDYVSLTSFTHHPFGQWFVIESPYKWRLKPSYNIPVDQLLDVLDQALMQGYTVAWGGDVSGHFTRTGLAALPPGVVPTQELRQQQFDNWTMTYDHVMHIYGRACDNEGNIYYMVKNSWGRVGDYQGTWYMSRDYLALNTVYLFLNRNALPRQLQLLMATMLPAD